MDVGQCRIRLDQPLVLQFKAETLRANHARPATKYVPVAIDLRQDWPTALRDAGFDPGVPPRGRQRGYCHTYPRPGRISCSSACKRSALRTVGSPSEAFGPDFFDPTYQAERREAMRRPAKKPASPKDPTWPTSGTRRNGKTSPTG